MITEINPIKCTGCGLCLDWCPSDVLRLNTHTEEITPCQAACPAGVDIRGYTYLLKTRGMADSIGVLREALPLPAVTSRVCFHPCETGCARRKVDKSVNISALERFVADYSLDAVAVPITRQHMAEVAVIGSGPAGLSCAYFLTRMGYAVTVFESESKPGGMLRLGIPQFRLPRNILDKEIGYIKRLGVEIKTNTVIGKDLTIQELRERGYKSIFVAVGAHSNLKLNIPGEEMKGVYHGLDFLRDFNQGNKVEMGERVVVAGRGYGALDSARVAVRLGASEVFIIRDKLRQKEINTLEKEGVEIINYTTPTRILGRQNRVIGIECLNIKGDRKNTDGGGRFVPVSGSKFEIEADMIITAAGQFTNLSFFPDEIKAKEGVIEVDPVSLETSLSGIFAGGDSVIGSSSVVESAASGKRAAISIDRYLRGLDPVSEREIKFKKVRKPPRQGMEKKERHITPLCEITDPVNDFEEVILGLDEDTAIMESRRCMTCGAKAYIAYHGDCLTCYRCELHCPYDAIYVHPFKMPDILKPINGGGKDG